MTSKLILLLLGALGLVSGGWAASIAFSDTSGPLSTLAMMGMMGYLFHSAVIFAALSFPLRQRRALTLLLLVWHVPEAILIATMGMGIPAEQQIYGVLFQSGFAALALLSWYLAKEDAPASAPQATQAV